MIFSKFIENSKHHNNPDLESFYHPSKFILYSAPASKLLHAPTPKQPLKLLHVYVFAFICWLTVFILSFNLLSMASFTSLSIFIIAALLFLSAKSNTWGKFLFLAFFFPEYNTFLCLCKSHYFFVIVKNWSFLNSNRSNSKFISLPSSSECCCCYFVC